MRFVSPLLSVLLAPLLAAGPLLSQSPSSPPAPAPLELRIIHPEPNGDGTHVAILVTDEAGAPVQGAAVVFRLVGGAPAGTFAGGSDHAIAETDKNGRAQAEIGRVPGGSTSPLAVQATASKGAAHAGLVFDQAFASSAPVPPAPVPVAAPAAVPVPFRTAAAAQRTAPAPPTPGVIVEQRQAGAQDDESPYANVPTRHTFGPDANAGAAGVSVLNGRGYGETGGHGARMKWVIAIAAAAGAGAAFALLHKGSSTSSSSGVTIGSPSVSVGHP